VQDQHTEVSRRSLNLFSVTEVAARIGADLETVTDWIEVGAIDRAVFGGGRFSKNELLRAALVFELVKFGLSPSSFVPSFVKSDSPTILPRHNSGLLRRAA
jgi:hypothetical protein